MWYQEYLPQSSLWCISFYCSNYHWSPIISLNFSPGTRDGNNLFLSLFTYASITTLLISSKMHQTLSLLLLFLIQSWYHIFAWILFMWLFLSMLSQITTTLRVGNVSANTFIYVPKYQTCLAAINIAKDH